MNNSKFINAFILISLLVFIASCGPKFSEKYEPYHESKEKTSSKEK